MYLILVYHETAGLGNIFIEQLPIALNYIEKSLSVFKENLQADYVQSRQAGFVRCCLNFRKINLQCHLPNCSSGRCHSP